MVVVFEFCVLQVDGGGEMGEGWSATVISPAMLSHIPQFIDIR
jgi:hypothetical protein